MPIALLIAYNGSKFHGFAKQPSVPTIEGEIVRALRSLGTNIDKIKYMSRTDSGVHAVYQIISFEGKFSAKSAHKLNAELPECIRVYAISRVSRDFHPRRKSKLKTYLYIAPDFGENYDRILWAVDFINSREHDFSSLAKRSSSLLEKTRMRIKVQLKISNDFQYFFFKGRYFLWEQVRRVVTLLKAFGLKRLTREEFISALLGRKLPWGISPAPAGGLILWHARVKDVRRWNYLIPEKIVKNWILNVAKRDAIINSRSWVFPPPRKFL